MPDPSYWLPATFMVLLGISTLAYVILDGFDLGVGMLLNRTGDEHKDLMIASIGPFWDANETWLVLAVGIVLVAFPRAQGIILGELYIPVVIMLCALILRGVAFDFRQKVPLHRKPRWNGIFLFGSWLTALTQGYMLGRYILAFEHGWPEQLFAALCALALAAAYQFIGGAWLVFKTHGELQRHALRWTRQALLASAAGLLLISLVSPLVSARIFELWFSLPNFFLLAPIPLLSAGLLLGMFVLLRHMPLAEDRLAWLPFAGAAAVFVLAFHGLAFSFWPYIIPDRLDLWEAAAAPGSLGLILAGVLIQLPVLFVCTLWVHRVFGGKATTLNYY